MTREQRLRWGSIGLAALVTSSVVVFACGREESETGMAAVDPVVSVGAENITVAQVAELRSGPAISGSLQPRTEARVRAEIAGPVEQTHADEGQRVRVGALLARLDDTAVRDAYLSAKSAVRTAESALQNAQRNLERCGCSSPARVGGEAACADYRSRSHQRGSQRP
jgi:multidrug efflux pump subunit AcrA (membrane-fusion protein)